MKGAPERILELCTHYAKEDDTAMLSAKEVDRIQKTVVQMSSKGLRGTVFMFHFCGYIRDVIWS